MDIDVPIRQDPDGTYRWWNGHIWRGGYATIDAALIAASQELCPCEAQGAEPCP